MLAIQNDLNGDPIKSITAEKQLLGARHLAHEGICYKLYIERRRKFTTNKGLQGSLIQDTC